jgi:hypothetical protein
MEIFEQKEWRGLVKDGSGLRDPRTSQLEFNTEPGRSKLQKVASRQEYLSGHLPYMACSIQSPGEHFVYVDTDGNPDSENGWGNALGHVVAFKWDGKDEVSTTAEVFVSGVHTGSAHNMTLSVVYATAQWFMQGRYRPDSTSEVVVTGATPITNGTWYWASLASTGTALTMKTYEDGSATATDDLSTAVSNHAWHGEPGYDYVGGLPGVYDSSLVKGSIAYKAFYSTSYEHPPWMTILGNSVQLPNTDHSFTPYNPSHSILPGKIQPVEANARSWLKRPRHGIQTATCSAGDYILNATGLGSEHGQSHLLDFSNGSMIRQNTVLFFLVDTNRDATLFRSE